MSATGSPQPDLRAQLFASGSFEENEVTVNQRALIDKILARYSSDFTVFRELIQNANDAGASDVEILFTTAPIATVGPMPPSPPLERTSSVASTSGASNKKDKDGSFSFASWFLNRATKVADKVGQVIKDGSLLAASPPKPTREVVSIVVRNNGKPFTKADWARVRSIAEGNPDEGKIGMFGVGFYSVFGLTEEPVISSGDNAMLFFWKKDQLFTKSGPLPPENRTEWTTFQLVLRDPDTLPLIPELGRFIATSIGFTASLKRIVVKMDDQVVISVSKKEGAKGKELLVPQNWVKRSPEGLFNVTGVSLRNVQMETELKAYEPPKPPLGALESGQMAPIAAPSQPPEKSALFFRLATLTMSVTLPRQLSTEMERTTKKKPAALTQITLLYSNSDELGSSQDGSTGGKIDRIFSDLVSAPPNQGSVIIGFRTQQTTGCSASVAAAFIPTVERESLDFVDRALAIWNRELLAMCGTLSRLIYEDDMGAVGMIWQPRPPAVSNTEPMRATKVDESDKEALAFAVRRCAHALKSFGFLAPSTPHATVGNVMREQFFLSAGSAVSLVTTRGVVPSRQARLLPAATKDSASLLAICKVTPLVPIELYEAAKDIVDSYRRTAIVGEIDFPDIAAEVDSRVFSETEIEALMKWWISIAGLRDRDRWAERIFGRLRFAVATSGEGKKPAVIVWRTLKFHLNPTRIPPDLADSLDGVLPFSISKGFQPAQLIEQFGLAELPLSQWVAGVASAADSKLETDAAFAERILSVVSKALGSNVSAGEKQKVIQVLQGRKCCPTKVGQFKPQEAYMPKVTLFDDLPTLQLANSKSLSDAFFRDLGLRDHVEVGLVLARVAQLGFNHEQLVRYLAGTHLTDLERSRLGQTKLFPREGGDPTKEGLWRPVDLYFGVEQPGLIVQNADLGLPLLAWTKNKLRLASEEGKLLVALGMRTALPFSEWLNLAADPKCSPERRKKLIQYLLERRDTTYFDYDGPKAAAKFLPALVTSPDGKTESQVCLPRECFADPTCSVLGFPVLDAEFRTSAAKLGVPEKPAIGACLQRLLASPPQTKEFTTQLFAYFGTRLGEIPSGDFVALNGKKFIPVPRTANKVTKTELMEPREVYLSGPEEPAFADLDLAVIDFGTAGNSFLRACGVAEKPSPQELAKRILRDPATFLVKVGAEKYLNLLRQLSVLPIDNQLLAEMKTQKWLLALKNEPRAAGTGPIVEDDFDVGRDASWVLAKADGIVLVDDPVLYQTFLPFSAPMESMIESFYEKLGSRWISREVAEDWQVVGSIRITDQAQKLQKLLRQRAPLLLYDVGQGGGRRESLTADLKNLQEMLNNLSVGEVDQVNIKRTFRGVIALTPTTSSVAQDNRSKKYLLITPNYDFFDVSQAIGKMLFKHPRLQDSLLLSTLLSSSLINLKRKGFPVDRLLNAEANVQKIAVLPPAAPPVSALPPIPAGGPEGAAAAASTNGTVMTPGDMSRSNPPATNNEDEQMSGWFEDLGNWWKGTEGKRPGQQTQGPQRIPGSFDDDTVGNGAPIPGTHRPAEHADPAQTERLRASLEAAIASSRPASESNFRATIPEPIDKPPVPMPQDYCRVLLDSDLVKEGTVRGIALFAEKNGSRDELQGLIDGGALDAFVSMLVDLAGVFGFPNLSAINIWHDARGSTVAFNRNRTIFVNLRYYAALHYRRAPLADAYSFWFMSLAHEIAHNFVADHNAEFSYYQGALAENYLPRFIPVVVARANERG